MSQTLSRITIVFYLVVVKRLQQCAQLPNEEKMRPLRDNAMAQLLNLQSSPGSKITRDIMASIANFLCSNLCRNLTVTDEIARQFHHSSRVHNAHYSSSPFSVDTEGNNISQSIELATQWQSAIGEPRYESDVQHAEIDYREPSNDDLNAVAAKAYSNPAATVTGVQNQSVRHVLSQNRHLIVKSGCGTGKSGIYILPLLYARSFGVKTKKILVISPYNALLSQHVGQARRYFQSTNLSVEGVLSADVELLERARFNSNLTFVSIQAFKMLKDKHEDVLRKSSFDVCVIDEVHNIFEELFRHRTWTSLKMISSYGWKLVALSATINDFISEKLSCYLGITGHVDRVGCHEYKIPDVAIRHVRVTHHGVLKQVTDFVEQTAYYDAHSQTANKCHIVTATRDDASEIQSLLSKKGIETAVLTSLTNKEDRERIMERWGNDPTMTVLATTLVDGIDSSFTQTVVMVKHAGSVVKTIQAIGRIRPPKQLGRASLFCYFGTDFDPGDHQEDLDRNQIVLESLFCSPDASRVEREEARREFATLFQSGGLDDVFNDKEGCLRQDLFRLINVDSQPCGICSKCNRYNHVAMAASSALDRQIKESDLRKRVVSSLADIGAACPGCLSPNCNGFKCINLGTGNSKVCIKCHGIHVSGDSCIARYVNVMGNACPYCFLPFHKDIDGTDIQLHQQGKCVHQDRIRQVLLFDLRGSNDNGRKAHDRLVRCSVNHDEWFATMERNLRTMKDSEISKASESTLDDEELMSFIF